MLKAIFKKAIDEAYEKARELGLEPRVFSFAIDSEGLGRGSVGAGIRTPEMNTPHAIFNLFYECSQSGLNDLEFILQNPMEISIQLIGGHRGSGLKRKINLDINENALIKVNNF